MPHSKRFAAPEKSRKKLVLRLGQTPASEQESGFDFSELKFRRLFEHMNEAVWVGDQNERTVYANPKFCQLLGYSLNEMLGRFSYDFWTPESARRVREVNEKVRTCGVSSAYEGDLLTKTGNRIPVLLNGTSLPDGGTIGFMTDMREIKRKEAEVETLLSRFDLAVRGSNDGLWYTEIPMETLSWNPNVDNFSKHTVWYSPRFKEILGYSSGEFPDTLESCVKRIHPDDLDRAMGLMWKIMQSKKSFEAEFRIRTRDGVFRWASIRGEAKVNLGSSTLFVAGSFRDVTESRRTSELLAKRAREAQLLYQANAHMRMVNSIHHVFSDLAKDMTAACRAIPPLNAFVEFDGKVFCSPPPDLRISHRVTEPIMVRGKRRGTIELRYSSFSKHQETLFNDDKQALQTLGTFIRKHVSSREIMERYQRLIKKSVMGIYILQDGVYKFVNPKFARLFSYKGAEVIGRKYNDLISDAVSHKMVEDLNSRKNFHMHTKGCRKDGTPIDLEVYTQRIDYHGKVAILGTVQDVTRIKRAEEKIRNFNRDLRQQITSRTEDLKRANYRLLSLNELKDEFIAVTSHELRSPLTAIRGYMSFIVQDPAVMNEVPAHLKDYLGRVFDNVEILNSLVNNILDVSRIETGRLELYPKPTDLVELAQDVIKNFGYQLGEKNLTVQFVNRFPSPSLMLNLDAIRMRQVFQNILDNAVKYSSPGQKILFEIESRGIGVQISVTDEGIGIPKAQIFDVFDKFKQAKNGQSSYRGGAGLGLFIVKKIMELHGGMIWAESTLNKGTTIRMQLPMSP